LNRRVDPKGSKPSLAASKPDPIPAWMGNPASCVKDGTSKRQN